MFTVRLSKQAAVWRNAVALSWSKLGQPTRIVLASTEGEVWKFSVGERVVALDWKAGLAHLAASNSPLVEKARIQIPK
jgi:hypothetical protein